MSHTTCRSGGMGAPGRELEIVTLCHSTAEIFTLRETKYEYEQMLMETKRCKSVHGLASANIECSELVPYRMA